MSKQDRLTDAAVPRTYSLAGRKGMERHYTRLQGKQLGSATHYVFAPSHDPTPRSWCLRKSEQRATLGMGRRFLVKMGASVCLLRIFQSCHYTQDCHLSRFITCHTAHQPDLCDVRDSAAAISSVSPGRLGGSQAAECEFSAVMSVDGLTPKGHPAIPYIDNLGRAC